jgi:hypothetical protein
MSYTEEEETPHEESLLQVRMLWLIITLKYIIKMEKEKEK